MNKEQPQYHTHTLANGLRCVFMPSQRVGYCGVVVNAGSRDDAPGCHGLAHFVEHTLFKGTERRRSRAISNRMECIGGELNAYTTKEETVVYTNFPAGYSARALDLLADLVANSCFPERELEKERQVVIDEINSYLDSPGELIFDEFEDRMFAGSGPGHNILGTPDSVEALQGRQCRQFLDRLYTPDNMAVYCVDNSSPSTAFRRMERCFGAMHFRRDALTERTIPLMPARFSETLSRDSHQSHTVVGARIPSRFWEKRHSMYLLNNYLGGPSMNSLLNRELREKRGYVYTVDSSLGLLSDCGLIAVYYGCDPEHVEPCAKIIERELEKLAETPMKRALFERMRRQYLGQLLVSTAQREAKAIAMGRSLLHFSEIHDTDYAERKIREVTPEEVRNCAEMILNAGLCRLTIE